jgi:hypothetical protein
MKEWYRDDKALYQQLSELLDDIYTTLGWQPRLVAPLIGRYAYWAMKKEEKRLAEGWTIEPKTFFEHNKAALAEVKDNTDLADSLDEKKIIPNITSLKPLPLSLQTSDRGNN